MQRNAIDLGRGLTGRRVVAGCKGEFGARRCPRAAAGGPAAAQELDFHANRRVARVQHERRDTRRRAAAGTAAVEAVKDAEDAAGVVWRFALNIVQAAGADTKDTSAGDAAREDFYVRLNAPYRAWILTLTFGADLLAARLQWRSTVRAAARSVADQLIADAPPAAWTGRVISEKLINLPQAEASFRAALRRKLPSTTDSSADTQEGSTP